MKRKAKTNSFPSSVNWRSGHQQKGVSLYLAMIILSIFLGISLGLSLILLTQIKMTRGIEESVKALYAADAGIEKMLFNLRPSDGEDLPNLTHFETETFCSQLLAPNCPLGYTVDPDCDAANYCINSIGSIGSSGFFKNTKRGLRIEY